MKTLIQLLFFFMALMLVTPALMAQQDSQAVILQYHHISSATPRSTSVTVDEFRLHMEYLRDHQFTVMPLPEVVAALKSGTPLPTKPAVITFDDAYVSVYEAAYPLLREYGWPFTVFVPTGLVGSNPRLYASWDQLREMAANGATLANHSVSHPYFLEQKPEEDDAAWLSRVKREVVDAEARLLEETGQTHKLHAYPYGEYNPELEAMLTELGYVGLGQHSGPINGDSNFTALPRFPFSGIYAPVRTFAPKVESLAFSLQVVDPASPVTDSKRPEAIVEFLNEYRFRDLACYVNDRPMAVQRIDPNSMKFAIRPTADLGGRRFRYNCTAPGQNGRYYWYSVPWINPSVPD